MRHFIFSKEVLIKCHIELFISQDEYICQIMKKILIAFYLTKEDCETLQSLSQVAVNYYKS